VIESGMPLVLLCAVLSGCHWVLPLQGASASEDVAPIEGGARSDLGDAASREEGALVDGSAAVDLQLPLDGPLLLDLAPTGDFPPGSDGQPRDLPPDLPPNLDGQPQDLAPKPDLPPGLDGQGPICSTTTSWLSSQCDKTLGSCSSYCIGATYSVSCTLTTGFTECTCRLNGQIYGNLVKSPGSTFSCASCMTAALGDCNFPF